MPGCHCTSKFRRLTWSQLQKYLISIERERCFLTVSFAMPTAVALSQWMGMGGCGCPIPASVSVDVVDLFSSKIVLG